jgi:hypothetical protein
MLELCAQVTVDVFAPTLMCIASAHLATCSARTASSSGFKCFPDALNFKYASSSFSGSDLLEFWPWPEPKWRRVGCSNGQPLLEFPACNDVAGLKHTVPQEKELEKECLTCEQLVWKEADCAGFQPAACVSNLPCLCLVEWHPLKPHSCRLTEKSDTKISLARRYVSSAKAYAPRCLMAASAKAPVHALDCKGCVQSYASMVNTCQKTSLLLCWIENTSLMLQPIRTCCCARMFRIGLRRSG